MLPIGHTCPLNLHVTDDGAADAPGCSVSAAMDRGSGLKASLLFANLLGLTKSPLVARFLGIPC